MTRTETHRGPSVITTGDGRKLFSECTTTYEDNFVEVNGSKINFGRVIMGPMKWFCEHPSGEVEPIVDMQSYLMNDARQTRDTRRKWWQIWRPKK